MPVIELETFILAPVERVFDLSRSVELHQASTAETRERAVAGKTTGLLEYGETVTWRARHLGVYQRFTSKITEYERPVFFVDEMQKGIFTRFKHQHYFEAKSSGTLMTDILHFQSPMGVLGRLANHLFLKRYLRNFLIRRNHTITTFAESETH